MRAHLLVSGRVQGVGFRYFTARHARRLGLAGFVQNLADGRVEVVAEGGRGALERLAAVLQRGPVGAAVRDVHVDWVETTERPAPPVATGEFVIR